VYIFKFFLEWRMNHARLCMKTHPHCMCELLCGQTSKVMYTCMYSGRVCSVAYRNALTSAGIIETTGMLGNVI